MTSDPKEQRLKALQRRFRAVRLRQEFIGDYRRRLRQPSTWVMGFLVFAAVMALLLARSWR